jgi:hypothetical protein
VEEVPDAGGCADLRVRAPQEGEGEDVRRAEEEVERGRLFLRGGLGAGAEECEGLLLAKPPVEQVRADAGSGGV